MQAEIATLLVADPVAGRELILELARSIAPERRRAGLQALGSVAEAGDVGLPEKAAGHLDSDVRLMAIEAVVDPAGDDRAFPVLVAASMQQGHSRMSSPIAATGYGPEPGPQRGRRGGAMI